MPFLPPVWFTQRQAKAEPVGSDTYRLTAPNLAEAFISIRPTQSGRWLAALRMTADGPDVAVTSQDYEMPADAWGAAFELYRTHIVT
jgi:hypothetical protein